jgi:glycine/serine hydroxymethyltransferase
MTTTQITAAEAIFSSILKERLGRGEYAYRKATAAALLLVDRQQLPYEFWTAAYAIEWGVQTGRASGAKVVALQQMKGREATEFIAQVAANAPNIAEAWDTASALLFAATGR